MRDEEAVRRVLDGEREAFRILVDRYAPVVFAVARRYCEDPAEAEDLAQEVFIRAYAGLEGFRGEAKFSSWLYRIATNRCRDHLRQREAMERARGDPEVNLPGSEWAADRFIGPERELERKELARRLQWALGELSPDYAVPFLLKYEQGLSYREMARRLDVRAGTLKVRVHRARARLRELLEGHV